MNAQRALRVFTTIGLAFWTVPAWGGDPSLGEILPRGAARGGKVAVVITGSRLADAVDLVFHETGIKLASLAAENDTKVKCEIEIAADCPLGTQAIRVRTKSGISNLRLFSVGNLKEMDEKEPNNDLAGAEVVPLGSTINGVITSEDVDYFAVNLDAGARLTAEVEALRLGGQLFDPKLRLFDAGGHELVSEDDTGLMAQDAAVVFTAPAAGRFVLAVSESAYGGAGDFYYRLHVGQFPRPLAFLPMGGKAGTTIEVKWLGDPGIAAQSAPLPGGPADGAFPLYAQNNLGVSPTPVSFRLTADPVTLETEPNNEAAKATPGPAPGSFDGVIDPAGDTDWFKFDAKKGQVYNARVWAKGLGSALDSVLTFANAAGSAIASDDDGAGIDSALRVTIPEDGAYTFSVRDHRMRGGPLFTYHLEVTPVQPHLEFGVLENLSAALNVPQGNHALILLSVKRADFDGPVSVSVTDLPPGVTAESSPALPGQTVCPVLLSAAGDAALGGALASINGVCSQNGAEVKGGLNYPVELIYGANKTIFLTHVAQRLAVAASEKAPYSIEIAQPKVPIVKSGSMELRVVAHRAEGFKGVIDLRMPWAPPGVGAGTATIAADASEGRLHIDANGSAAVGAWRIALTGSSGGYVVSTPFTSIEVAEPWVSFDVANVETEQGKPVEAVVKVTQSHDYSGTYKAQLLGFPKGVTTTELDMTHDTKELKFPLTVAADAPAGKFPGLFVRVTLQSDGEPIQHQAGGGQLTIQKPLPPALQQAAPPPKPEQPKAGEPERKTRFPGS
ncbi:MAG: pre-peptidase C-terminal domain-containing protein [Candidatus Hydrogenedentes bacterium]|nr:pre-peptidase C-terminal domain-containing protein [Candidatus Hydrogenedentota bacterium]